MVVHLFSILYKAVTYLHCGGPAVVCDTRIQKVLPDLRVVYGSQGDLTISETCRDYTLTGHRTRTCVANEKVIDQGNVQPAAWNMGRILKEAGNWLSL